MAKICHSEGHEDLVVLVQHVWSTHREARKTLRSQYVVNSIHM